MRERLFYLYGDIVIAQALHRSVLLLLVCLLTHGQYHYYTGGHGSDDGTIVYRERKCRACSSVGVSKIR